MKRDIDHFRGCLLGGAVGDALGWPVPGRSCLSALLSGKIGTTKEPINNSKGCGGVMRVAPVGLFYEKNYAFDMAVDFAALTHGHPTGYLAAGALAYMIALIIEGGELETIIERTIKKLSNYEGNEECDKSLIKAVEFAKSDISEIDAISQLGEGWVAEEALGISTYCALKYKNNFKKGIITAVNHDGDSDSTGAITGNILGAYLGVNSIPKEWVDKVELLVELLSRILMKRMELEELEWIFIQKFKTNIMSCLHKTS